MWTSGGWGKKGDSLISECDNSSLREVEEAIALNSIDDYQGIPHLLACVAIEVQIDLFDGMNIGPVDVGNHLLSGTSGCGTGVGSSSREHEVTPTMQHSRRIAEGNQRNLFMILRLLEYQLHERAEVATPNFPLVGTRILFPNNALIALVI